MNERARRAYERWLARGGDDSIKAREYILSQEPPNAMPIKPFCDLEKVSVDEVFEEMEIK